MIPTSVSHNQENAMQAISVQTHPSITRLLKQWQTGQSEALDDLVKLAYTKLTSISHLLLQKENRFRTLQTQGLVNEAYLRFHELKNLSWKDRDHFFAVWTGIMRRILIDRARSGLAEKRGGGGIKVTLSDAVAKQPEFDVLDLENALNQLERIEPVLRQVVDLRYFAGLTVDEIAAVLEVSPATIKRKWHFARAWLYRKLCD